MIEKIRVSLWDILTFFLSGLVFACWALSYATLTKAVRAPEIIEYVVKLPNSVTLFLGPVLLTALGLLLEPVANYFDKAVINLFWFRLFPSDKRRKQEERVLREIIQTSYLLLIRLLQQGTMPWGFAVQQAQWSAGLLKQPDKHELSRPTEGFHGRRISNLQGLRVG